jgi:hypothetical protein
MAETPKYLLDALDLVTRPRAPSPEAFGGGGQGRAAALHVRRVRGIFEDKNIVAVGISEKVTEGKDTGALSVCFYVEKKVPQSRIRAGKLIPPVIASRDGTAVFTDVKVLGRVRPEVQKKVTPIQSGFSIAHKDVTAGTVAAIVKKGNKLFILSNSHVLADSGLAKLNDEILYPGPADGGILPRHLVGTLAKFAKFKVGGEFVNHVDAALGVIDPDRLDELDFSIHGLRGAPRTISPKRGMTVVKSGRTTGKTEGKVEDVNFRLVLDYPRVGQVGYLEQVLCTRYTKPGDSGSLVVDKESGKIVGLHFAGANGGSVFNPIAEVVAALKFTFTKS